LQELPRFPRNITKNFKNVAEIAEKEGDSQEKLEKLYTLKKVVPRVGEIGSDI